MQQLETKIEQFFTKNAPVQLPEASRKSLVEYFPWVALGLGVLLLFAAWSLYQAATIADRWAASVDSLNRLYGTGAPVVTGVGIAAWIGIALLLAEAVMMFMAFAPLKERKKQGWNLLFWVNLLYAAYAVFSLFAYRDFGSFLLSAVSTVIGLYFLFQIRGYYTGTKHIASHAEHTTTSDAPKNHK